MEPLPLLPSIKNRVTPEIGYLVREVFQNSLRVETATWRRNHDSRKIGEKTNTVINDHKETLDDLEYAELEIMRTQGYRLCRDQMIVSNERATELLRLKRHPLYIDLHPTIVEKYPLLQSDDLLPTTREQLTDFRLDKKDRIKMKKRLYKSRDSLLEELVLPTDIIPRSCRFDRLMEQKFRRTKLKNRSAMNRALAHKRSIIKSENLKTILVAEPEELLFRNFEYGKRYKKTVAIKNVSNSMARYKIERRSVNSRFAILQDSKTTERSKIAPGMEVRLTVSFLCDVVEDPEEFLLVNVECGKTVCVKMKAYRDAPLLREAADVVPPAGYSESVVASMENSSSSVHSMTEGKFGAKINEEQVTTEAMENSKEYRKKETNLEKRRRVNLGANFECGKCFVGERILVSRKLVNDGGSGRFFIMSEMDWSSMNIDDVTDCNMIFVPPFAVWPIYFNLKSGEQIDTLTYFCPESYGTQVDKLYILCDNHAVHTIELIGDGLLYEPDCLRFSENVERVSFDEKNHETIFRYRLNLPDEESGNDGLGNSILVANASGLEMYYRWEKIANNENLDIRPASGFLSPGSTTSFRIVALSEDLRDGEYLAILRFCIEDIPLAALPKDYNLRIEESRTRRRNSPTTVDILVADIEVWVPRNPRSSQDSPRLGSGEKLDGEIIRSSDEAEENDDTNYRRLSETAVQNFGEESSVTSDDGLICRLESLRCGGYFRGVENCRILRSVSLGSIENLDIGAPDIPRLDFRAPTSNTAILIPGSLLYVGIERVYKLTLRSWICKPLIYAWGQPLVNDGCKMKVQFNPDKGLIPAIGAAEIEVTCLPTDTGTIENFFIPCFIEGHQFPIMLGIECTVDSLYVTFLFLPTSDGVLSPCVDSVRVEWRKDGHTSALNLNNLKMDRDCRIEEEHELKNINLDAGYVVATTAVDPKPEDVERVSPQSANNQENEERNKSYGKFNSVNDAAAESKLEEIETPGPRSWEKLLDGIVWTEDQPQEFISLPELRAVVPFHKTIVPPITQALAMEFVDLPLRTVKKRTFVIRNETPAESTFLIESKQFSPLKIIRELNPRETIDVAYANVMGNKSENYWEKIKPPGQSVVLLIEPTSGKLASHDTVPIDIYVYADTWGVYVDEITVVIAGLPDYVFGVCIQVVGSPISYPICKSGTNKTPILRFGTLDLSAESVTRKIMIENTSGVTVAINWYSYLIDPKSSSPFNVILQMFSPLTNKIANMESGESETGEKISVASSETESQQSGENSDTDDATITQRTSSSSDPSRSCCSKGINLSEGISSQGETRRAKPNFRTEFLNNVYAEYTTESETNSLLSASEQSEEKETDLEFDLTPYYGELDYSLFTVSPTELIVPVNERRWIQVTLNKTNDRLSVENFKNEVRGRLMGFIRVAPMDKYKADCFSRDDGVRLAPTEIELRATVLETGKSVENLKISSKGIVPDYAENYLLEEYGSWEDEDYYCDA